MKKRERDNLMLVLLAFTAWHAYQAHVAAEQAAVLAAGEADFDPLSWDAWKKSIRDQTVSTVVQKAGRFIFRRIIP